MTRACGVLAIVLGACDARAPSAGVSGTNERILHGEPSPPGLEDGVLALRTEVDGVELVCSAVLVAPNLALTARHCVSYFVRGRFSCTVQGELVSADPGAGSLGAHLPAEDLEFYGGEPPREAPLARGAFVLSTLSEAICLNDVAFVGLDRALDLPTLPLRLGARARRGEAVKLVGYGLDESMVEGGQLDLRTQPRLRNVELVIEDLGPKSSDELITTTPPRTIVVEGPSGCFGDSGGPLLARDTDAVLGIYSLLAGSTCRAPDGRHFFTHLPDFPALTRDAFERAGHEPVPESVETGAAGAGGAPDQPTSAGGEGGATAGARDGGGDAGAHSAAAGEGGHAAAGAPEEAGQPGSSGSTGQGGHAPVVPRQKASSEGCALAVASTRAPRSLLVMLAAACCALLVRRRRALSDVPRADPLRRSPAPLP